MVPRRLCSKEAAEYLSVSPRQLARWRAEGGGPPYIALSPKIIRYDPADIDHWCRMRRSDRNGINRHQSAA